MLSPTKTFSPFFSQSNRRFPTKPPSLTHFWPPTQLVLGAFFRLVPGFVQFFVFPPLPTHQVLAVWNPVPRLRQRRSMGSLLDFGSSCFGVFFSCLGSDGDVSRGWVPLPIPRPVPTSFSFQPKGWAVTLASGLTDAGG